MLYTYYGDDFTGSTDVLETLAVAGVATVLFLVEPTPEDLAQFPAIEALGFAGDSRSRSPEWMSANLPRIFKQLKSFGGAVTHYKTCSTFDSAPHVGSIGRAVELGAESFSGQFVPIVVGAPHLGRYVVFGNLFARANGEVYRIDRHPTMSRHPVTPMLEADLRRHLAAQTNLPIGLLDYRELTAEALARVLEVKPTAVLFDTLDLASQAAAGELIWTAARQQPMFAAGSSGLTQALVSAWRTQRLLSNAIAVPPLRETARILVVSGSCSPVTRGQIEWATANGFCGIRVDPEALITDADAGNEAHSRALAAIAAGLSPILYTALGPLPAKAAAHDAGLGIALGKLLHRILAESSIRRTVLCGGDTSSHAIQQLPVRALTWAGPLAPGAPMCRAHAPGTRFHEQELVLKGGQIGSPRFFAEVRQGHSG